jgi:tRNA threonylcarbamoyl adenosine modification protein YeaZ
VLLALETSTDHVSVALHDGDGIVAGLSIDAARRHAETLVPAVQDVLDQAGVGLDAVTKVAVGVGPGGFTGLRVGVVTALTFAAARGVPCVGVLSLDALAADAISTGSVGAHEAFSVAVDARRREVFWARYVEGRRDGDAAAGDPRHLAAHELADLTVVGDAADRYPDVFARAIVAAPSAAAVAQIVNDHDRGFDTFDVLPARPVYVRSPDATPPAARKPVTPVAPAPDGSGGTP